MTVHVVAPPRPVFDHLARLSDARGLHEHALLDTPRPAHGYCVDDVARGLVVVSRQPDPDATLRLLAEVYLGFVLSAGSPSGEFRNRMSTDGVWTDQPSLGDWWGRAIWGLAVAACDAATPGARARALAGFRVAAQRRSPHARAMAFAGIGAARILRDLPGERAARLLLRDCAVALSGHVPDWCWPEPRLRYANAAVAEALIAAGGVMRDRHFLGRGLELLDFLLTIETRAGHLSVTPAAGRGPGDNGPGFDQQPIEVSSLAEACTTAYRVTADPRWLAGVDLAWRWFLGDNDTGVPMFDSVTGAGYDGLEATGRNLNQGAESTLAMLATAQQVRIAHDLS